MTDRAWIRYDSDDAGAVSLPGYVNPIPLVVEPGDVFSIDADHADDVTASDRFVAVDEPVGSSANGKLTKAQLAAKLGDDVDPNAHSKADLVAMADDYDLTHPEPPGGPTDAGDPEGNPS